MREQLSILHRNTKALSNISPIEDENESIGIHIPNNTQERDNNK